MIRNIILSTSLLLSSLGATAAGYVRQGSTVTVRVEQPTARSPRWVRLQVVADKIIRVEATADAIFPVKQSLIIVPQTTGASRVDVSEDRNHVTVSTPQLRATVTKSSGRVVFHDAQGRQILAEDAQAGKQLIPYTVPAREIGVDIDRVPAAQRQGYSWQLLFDDPGQEALYGLGQHQSEELNMKGKNEDLFQYNTKVSVPFVVSTRGYGVLWDSYSYCRFGNPDDYQQLHRVFRLYDREGRPGHLTGTYTDAAGRTTVRDEDSLYYEYALPPIAARGLTDIGVGNLPQGFKLKGSHVTYEGYIEAQADQLARFILYYAGYIKVFLDGREVVPERWRTAWNPNAYKFTFPLKQGVRTKILIDWQPDGDVSYCGLRAASPRPESEQQRLSVWSEMAQDLDYYFIAGQNLDEVIAGYRHLTGRAQVYPKWAFGFWQSRERYKTSGEIEQTLAEFRRRQIPIDNIVQDWNYWRDDQWGSHDFDPARFAHPQAMLDSVHAMHGRFMISVWPKFYTNTDHYKALDRNGWMYHQAVHDSIYDWIGYMGSFYDAYHPSARKMFWQQMNDRLYSRYNHGIDAWWMDASEPNVRDCTPMWYRKALSGPTALGTATEYFNAYSVVNADAIYHGQRSVNPNQRVFLLTRSGFAGEQRYSTATWSGDIATRWEDMRAQVTAGLNYSMSGLPIWGMDQGGFCVEDRYVSAQQLFDRTGQENSDLREWRELQARWNQFGCFVPIYRAHGQWPLREVWNIAPEHHEAYQSIVWYDRLRYRLMPYIYSLAGAVHLNHYTMMRGLAMDHGTDPQVYDVKDQWLFGPSLMACPVTQYGARSRQVYLPRTRGWYDLYTGQHHQGGQTITAPAPYTRIPVYVPEGSIIPFGPAMQWSDERQADTLRLYVYAGHDGQFTLYEDEGTNYNYEQGRYATIPISYDDARRTLTIGRREGRFEGMLSQRRFEVVLVSADRRQPLDLDHPQGRMVVYKGKPVQVKL